MSTENGNPPDAKQDHLRHPGRRRVPFLVGVAVLLSCASAAWTTWSLVDLLGVGLIGLTVAATADLIWTSVIYCEYKGVGDPKAVRAIGWIAVAAVGGFIFWHGWQLGSIEVAITGPFLTLGTKAVWELALLAEKDPTDLTRQQKEQLHNEARDTDFARKQAQAALSRKEVEDLAQEKEEERRQAALLRKDRHQHEVELARIHQEGELERARNSVLQEELEGKFNSLEQFQRNVPMFALMAEMAKNEGITTPFGGLPQQVTGVTPSHKLPQGSPDMEAADDVDEPHATGGESYPTPVPARPLAAESRLKNVVHVRLGDIRLAQQRQRFVAALWWLRKDANSRISQAEFIRWFNAIRDSSTPELKAPYLSKAIKAHSEDSFSPEEWDEATEEMNSRVQNQDPEWQSHSAAGM